jgi:hypothetical protein
MFYGKRRETKSRVIGISLPERVRVRPVVDCEALRATPVSATPPALSEGAPQPASESSRGRPTRRKRMVKPGLERAVWSLVVHTPDASG